MRIFPATCSTEPVRTRVERSETQTINRAEEIAGHQAADLCGIRLAEVKDGPVQISRNRAAYKARQFISKPTIKTHKPNRESTAPAGELMRPMTVDLIFGLLAGLSVASANFARTQQTIGRTALEAGKHTIAFDPGIRIQ
jgi:hypothetical protein